MSAGRLRADVVVVGSGAGGGPAAAVLAERGLDVLVLEAGPRLAAADFRDDEWSMRTRLGRIAASEDALHSFYAGACVGGSTVVNDALCWRPPPEVLADWGRELGAGWGAELAPYVERAWVDVHAEPTTRAYLNRNAHALERGAQHLGWAGEAMPRNVRGCARLGRCNLGCPIDAKQSSLVSYVPRAEAAGARVVANVRVERVRIAEGKVRGIEATRMDPQTRRPRDTLLVDAPRVVLAAGVLSTPALLTRSGVPGAGAGFQAHSSSTVTARFAEPIHGYYGPTMAYAVSEFSDVNGGAGPGYMLENTAVRPLQTASVLPDFGAAHERAMAALSHLAHAVVVLRDRTRGRIAPGEDAARPAIAYALAADDLERMRHALGSAARAYLAAGAEEVWLPLHGYGPVRSEAELRKLATAPLGRSRFSLLYAVHLFGGAAMGAGRGGSVCDPEGAVWDVAGLHVSDASALPGNTGVNPQITIMAHALRAAEAVS